MVVVRSVMSSVWSLTVVVEENREMIEGIAAAAAAASPTGPRPAAVPAIGPPDAG